MKLLVCGKFLNNDIFIEKVRYLGFEVRVVDEEKREIHSGLENVDGVICNTFFLHNDIARFKNLKFVHFISSGLDKAPLEYMEKNGIRVFNARGVYNVPIAEFVILKILEVYKSSKKFFKQQEKRLWEKQRNLLELTNKNVAIIGFGGIGKELAKRLKSFGVNVIGVRNRDLDAEERTLVDEFFLTYNLDEALIKSDIIVLCLPLTEKTINIIDKRRISLMKENSILVNVSRGEVLDETELEKSVSKGKFLGVCLDVFEHEPLTKNSSLWGYERVTVTPHNAFVSDKTQERLFDLIIKNLKSL